mmetsp:Transcript_23168/g.36220  ORF Transcript_23168/g.36220 Transcript_23168/m.36220 type:complete len:196 (+) Transcript_23168:59-646(+)
MRIMPPFYNDESTPPRRNYYNNDEKIIPSILSHKTLSYVKIETKVADAETLSTRLLEEYYDDDMIDNEQEQCDSKQHLDCKKHPLLILSCIYMILVTVNTIILSSTKDFDSTTNNNWWKICNVCNVLSAYMGIIAAIYQSRILAAITSCWWLFEMFFGMFRLALMYWGIIPDTAVRTWFIAYTVSSYLVRLLGLG